MRMLALGVRFLLELAALAALFYVGIAAVSGLLGWLVGLTLMAVAATAWGLYVAPRATFAAPEGVRWAVELIVFAAACAGLLLADRSTLAAVLGGVYALDRLALWASGAPAFEPDPRSN